VCLSDIYLTYLERFKEPRVLDPPRYAFKEIVLKGRNRRLLFVSDSVGQRKCKSEQKYEPRGKACLPYNLLPLGRGVVRVGMSPKAHYKYTGVPGGKDLTSGECSLGQTITI